MSDNAPSLSYKDAGVDIDKADRLVDRIKSLAGKARNPLVVDDIGGFAALCSLPQGLNNPLLVSSTDGVGTKLAVAIETGQHDTIGIDLVAMCVNDVLTTGARPLFFLDYFATGQLELEVAEAIIAGIVAGCQQAGCALIGGETAEMPGFYPQGHYDLAGFCVGIVEQDARLGAHRVQSGDRVLGIAASGLHSNGFSLTRKIVASAGLSLDEKVEGRPLKEWLLEPTRIYAEHVTALQSHAQLHALCHITGGGIPGNLPRVLPDGLGAQLNATAWPQPAIFAFLQTHGRVSPDEMQRVYNLGLGLMAVVSRESSAAALQVLNQTHVQAWDVGEIIETTDDARVIWR